MSDNHSTSTEADAPAVPPENDDAPGTTTMELQLRFDENGRTAAAVTATADEHVNVSLDYQPKTVMTKLTQISEQISEKEGNNSNEPGQKKTRLDELLLDCELSDCGLLPRTFWMPATGVKPRCALEQMALEIFHQHVPDEFLKAHDLSLSGAEWWVQLRPSPPVTGRYSMLSKDGDDDDEMTKTGISFHWDKDEDLRLLTGGSMFVHPHISTVTYLTGLGAPTMVLNYRVDPMSGDWLDATATADGEEVVQGYVSCPQQGKHLSFDGRYLHAAPSDLMPSGLFEQQCCIENYPSSKTSDSDQKQQCKILERRHRRVTFLVNIWLHYKPFNVNMFPDTMLDNTTPSSNTCYLFEKQSEEDKSTTTTCEYKAIEIHSAHKSGEASTCPANTKRFTWPLGCDDGPKESIHVDMPLDTIQNEMKSGGSVQITWKQSMEGKELDHKSNVICLLKEPAVGLSSVNEQTCTQISTETGPLQIAETQIDESVDTNIKRQRID